MWCQGIGTVESFTAAEIWPVCSLVTAEVRVTLAQDLPVSGVDLFLGNDLTGGRVWVSLPSVDRVLKFQW